MKHFVIEIKYTVPFEELGEVIPMHREFLNVGYKNGWLLMSGPQNPKTGGIVIARAENENILLEYFKKDPYAVHNVAEHKFTEFNPLMHQEFLKDWL